MLLLGWVDHKSSISLSCSACLDGNREREPTFVFDLLPIFAIVVFLSPLYLASPSCSSTRPHHSWQGWPPLSPACQGRRCANQSPSLWTSRISFTVVVICMKFHRTDLFSSCSLLNRCSPPLVKPYRPLLIKSAKVNLKPILIAIMGIPCAVSIHFKLLTESQKAGPPCLGQLRSSML